MPRKDFRDGVFQNETPSKPGKPRCRESFGVLLLIQTGNPVLLRIFRPLAGARLLFQSVSAGYAAGEVAQIPAELVPVRIPATV